MAFLFIVAKRKPCAPIAQYKYSDTHRSAEEDNHACLAAMVPFQEWWVHATSRAVGESHGSLGTWEAPEKPQEDPACLSVGVWEAHLLEVEIQQQWWVEEELGGMGRAATQEAWQLGTEMGQSSVEALQGKLKAGKWEGAL